MQIKYFGSTRLYARQDELRTSCYKETLTCLTRAPCFSNKNLEMYNEAFSNSSWWIQRICSTLLHVFNTTRTLLYGAFWSEYWRKISFNRDATECTDQFCLFHTKMNLKNTFYLPWKWTLIKTWTKTIFVNVICCSIQSVNQSNWALSVCFKSFDAWHLVLASLFHWSNKSSKFRF